MKVRDFIGKKVSLEMAKALDYVAYVEADDGDEFDTLVVYLYNFELNGITDKNGFTGYSIEVRLKDNTITQISRMANLSMCGGGCDSERSRLSKSLEDEAKEKLHQIVSYIK